MELTTGYKRTELGVLPVDWDVKLLPDVCRFRGGKAHEQYVSDAGEYVCVNSKFISTGGRVRKYSSANFCPAKPNDILMVMSDLPNGKALAKAYLVKEGDKYAVNQRVCALTPYLDDAGYLFYTLNRNPYFLKFDDGVSQTHLLNPVFQKCPLPIPRLVQEQRAIATALSDVDALIAGLERLIAKKRDIKQAAMQHLLTGQARLPGFSGDWDQGAFGDVVSSLEAGVSVNSTDGAPEKGVPCVLKTSALVGGLFLPHEAKVIEARDITRARTSPKRDTILISRMNTPMLVGEVAYVPEDFDALFLPDRVWMVQFNLGKRVCARWLAYVLSSRTYRGYLRDVATGTSGSMKNISKGALLSLPIRYPSFEEQNAIATVLSDMDADLSALESRLAKTRALKQGMMQELLTGRTRLV